MVRQYSSGKEPHLTLLYLGENPLTPAELSHITGYIEHAASQISSFGLEVERRGVLGDKEADVLFFQKRWAKQMAEFRSHLLQDELINKLYHSIEQFPEWTPHLTMGFPDTPAKPDKREYQRFSYVRFDRIALWTDDSTGPTFQLNSDDYGMEVAMSEKQGAGLAAAILANLKEDAIQYGVPGMRWGKRKKSSVPNATTRVTQDSKTGKVTVSGGHGIKASPDFVKSAHAKQVARKSGTKALSNAELKTLVERMNLEQQLAKLTPPSKVTKTRRFVGKTMGRIGEQQLNMVLNQAANQQIANALAKAKR